MNLEKIVSAQVVLTAASGARPGPRTRITSENIREWVPSAETIVHVSGELRRMGFEVGECVGNNFSIAATVQLFESCFHTKLRETKRGGVEFARHGRDLAAELIPPELQAQIAAITFTPPPDFGPGATSSFD